jgi:rare lipoprotein A
MISNGILWLTSFTGGTVMLTALPMGLASPTQFTANLVKDQHQFFTNAQQHKNAWQKIFISKTLFTFDWINKQLSSHRNTATIPDLTTFKAKETKFCSPVPENITAQTPLKLCTS